MYKNNYQVEVLVNGKNVKEFNHYVNNEYKTFIEGKENSQYLIKVKNNGSKKILAIVAVDGLSVVSGQKTNGRDGRGYIVQPYSEIKIKGWRLNDQEISSFKFGRAANSYAASKEMEDNTGIISVSIIEEKEIKQEINWSEMPTPDPAPYYPKKNPWSDPWGHPYPYKVICSNDYNSTTLSALASNDSKSLKRSLSLGTEFGQKQNDSIKRCGFEKGETVAIFNIYYGSRADLQNLGIKFDNTKEVNLPEGFNEYCSPPKGWRG